MCNGEEWAIVLAGGEGTRLGVLTTHGGVATPKQYCSLRGGRSLLGDAIARAAQVVAFERIVVVVAAAHRSLWEDELSGLPPENVVVQPGNRGTAPGILLPLFSILERDPAARVVVLPSDHFVEHERVLTVALRLALEAAERDGRRLVLLGITPDAPETGYGWITSERGTGGLERVTAFAEKPDAARAAEFLERGAVWHSFLFAARGTTLRELFERALPRASSRLADAVRAPWTRRQALIDAAYASLEAVDFSRDLLEGWVERLDLLRVPACGWTDLGTPERVATCVAALERAGPVATTGREAARRRARFDLASALEGWRRAEPGVLAQPA